MARIIQTDGRRKKDDPLLPAWFKEAVDREYERVFRARGIPAPRVSTWLLEPTVTEERRVRR